MPDEILTLADAETLVRDALIASDTSAANAASVARALVRAEADGQRGHGLSRVPTYAAQARVGKIRGHATPIVEQAAPAALRADAAYGFAFPAFDLTIPLLADLAARTGIAAAAIRRSHHFGVAGHPCEALAERGLIAFVYGNSPKALAPHGATRPVLGTNPIAFAAPMADGPPLVIDLAVTTVARGKILAAKEAGRQIPEGWALNSAGEPTTDPAAALLGSMAPIAGPKGAALALMVEVMSACLVGAAMGTEGSSLLNADGGPPDLGQSVIALDPQALSGGVYLSRMADLAAIYAATEGARLPGTTRLANRARAATEGLTLPASLLASIRAIASGAD
jgi:(2R)-3-sulfolactate dehydrogenase (NADP+)